MSRDALDRFHPAIARWFQESCVDLKWPLPIARLAAEDLERLGFMREDPLMILYWGFGAGS